ncbi:hypothetical protein [Dokdonella sp.]|uniref:hypothetical protein n=1 Tax=Dokdonella sp. TaxID=2291710 RepID=UPI0031C3A988|nr:hypothetical protein [Dokdonella sp.]
MNGAYTRLAAERAAPMDASRGETIASDPRGLRTWLDSLPLANLAVAAQRISAGLGSLNAQSLPAAARLAALETLRAPMLQLAAALERQIIGGGFPLPAQQQGFGELALAFQRDLARGYRTCLVDLTAPRGTLAFLRGKSVALAAVRALQHGGEHLARSYLLYRAPERGTWQALHDVHAFISALRLEERGVTEPGSEAGVSARDSYLQSLLLALANPYHCTQREQVEVRALMGALAPHARLRERNAGAGGVRVPIDSDRGPGYLDHERGEGARESVVLDLDDLGRFVRERLARAQGAHALLLQRPGQAALEVSVATWQQSMDSLAEQRARGHARIGGDHLLDTVLGLHDLHCVAAGGDIFETFLRSVPGTSSQAAEGERAAWRMPNSGLQRGALRKARVLDQGLGGYRILWPRDGDGEGVRARVGELVGLALPAGPQDDGDNDWMVGVIRWLRIDANGSVECGVRLLARSPLPVAVRSLRDGGGRSPLRGLLLAPLDGRRDADYTQLLSSTEVEREARDLEIGIPLDTLALPRPARRLHPATLPLVEDGATYRIFGLPDGASTAAA